MENKMYLYQGDKQLKGCGKKVIRHGTLRGLVQHGVNGVCGYTDEVATQICGACAKKQAVSSEVV